MAIFSPLADKAVGALTRSRADLLRAQKAQATHAAKQPTGDDVSADAIYIWKREQTDHNLRVQSAADALAIAEAASARLQAEAAAREVEAAHRAEEKAAAAGEKIARELAALLQKSAEKLAELETSRARTANANADRGSRPYIADAEDRVRRAPAKTLPAVYREETVWLDADGRTPSQFKVVANEYVPADHGAFRRVTRQVEETPQMWVPPMMPERWADTIKLFGIDGKPLWPL